MPSVKIEYGETITTQRFSTSKQIDPKAWVEAERKDVGD